MFRFELSLNRRNLKRWVLPVKRLGTRLVPLAIILFCLVEITAVPVSAQELAPARLDGDASAAYYLSRYGLADLYAKRVDNRGLGFEPLYGLRNMREVLKGIVYRGGANNAYHRNGVRNNSNPLPNDGLENLCEEGFGTAIYLYPTRYATAPSNLNCTSRIDGLANSFDYLQKSPLASDTAAKQILQLVFDRITSSTDHRPIYLHCWNGWHASGFISSLVLRQFCGFSGAQATAYWDRNTDGNNKDASYETIRRRIRNFAPDPGMAISTDLQNTICLAP